MITFKITTHALRQCQIVEIFCGPRFVGAIYPGDPETIVGRREIKFLSTHLEAKTHGGGLHSVTFRFEEE